MEDYIFNMNAYVMLSLVTCMPVENVRRVTKEYGIEGISAIIVFNSYFYTNHLKVGYRDDLDAIALKYFGEEGRFMLKKFIKSKIFEVHDNGMIYPSCLFSVIQMHKVPCFFDIYRLQNLNKNNIRADYSEVISDNKKILGMCMEEASGSLPYYMRDVIRNDSFKNCLYTAVYYYLLHSKYCIGNLTDINIIARCLGKNWSDIIKIIKDDGLVAFDNDKLHFYIPEMRRCKGFLRHPGEYEISEAVKNYDSRYIYINIKNNEL